MAERVPHTDNIEVRQAIQRLNVNTQSAEEDIAALQIDVAANVAALQGGTAGQLYVCDEDEYGTWTTFQHDALGGLDDDDHAQYHNNTRGDARYYTKTLLDGGQLDDRYFTEAEHINSSAGAGDAGKPIVLNASGYVDSTMVSAAGVDHGGLGGLTDDDHTQYILHNGTRAFTAYLDINEIEEPGTPATDVVRLWIEDFKGFSFINFKDDTGMVRKLVRDNVFVGQATVDLDIGQAVYADGSSGNVPTLSPADASHLATMPSVGVTVESAYAGEYVRVMQVGLLEHINTDAFTEGDILFVSATVPGALTATAPLYPNIHQEVGTVLVKGVGNGAIQVIARSMFNEGILDHGGLLGLADDDHGQYHNDARAATWLAANHESTYAHADISSNKAELQGGGDGQIYVSNGTGYGTWTDYQPIPVDTAPPSGYNVLIWAEGEPEPEWNASYKFVPTGAAEKQFLHYSVLDNVEWTGSNLDSGNLVYVSDEFGTPSGTAKLTHDGTDFTLATGSDIIFTDNVATEMLYAGANKEVKSTAKLTHDGTNFTLATGSALKSTDVLLLIPAASKAIQFRSGGDARGDYAIDLQAQFSTNADSEVASGTASICIGNRCTASGTSSVSIGANSDATATYSLALGGGCQSTAAGAYSAGYLCRGNAEYSFVVGNGGVSTIYGQFVRGARYSAAIGDRQASEVTVWRNTTDDTQTEIFACGISGSGTSDLVIPENTLWGFFIEANARETNNDYSVNRWVISGAIKRDTGGNATIVYQTPIDSHADDATWAFDVDADTSNQRLRFRVTGATGNNISWLASVRLQQITG